MLGLPFIQHGDQLLLGSGGELEVGTDELDRALFGLGVDVGVDHQVVEGLGVSHQDVALGVGLDDVHGLGQQGAVVPDTLRVHQVVIVPGLQPLQARMVGPLWGLFGLGFLLGAQRATSWGRVISGLSLPMMKVYSLVVVKSSAKATLVGFMPR